MKKYLVFLSLLFLSGSSFAVRTRNNGSSAGGGSGDITDVNAGTGIVVTGPTGPTPSVAVDPTYVILNQNSLQANTTAYPNFLYVNSSATIYGPFRSTGTLTIQPTVGGFKFSMDPTSSAFIVDQQTGSADAGSLRFRTLGSDKFYIDTDVSQVHIAASTGTTITDRVLFNKTNDTITFNPSMGGFSIKFGTMTFNFGADPVTFNWNTTDGTFAVTNGTFTVNEVLRVGGGVLEIPVGAAPSLPYVGTIALDTTDSSLIARNASEAFSVGFASKSYSVTISSGIGWDSLNIPIFSAPTDRAITIRSVRATTMAGTSLTFNIDERPYASMASAGTNITASNIVAVTTGTERIVFSNASIAAGAHLMFVTSTSASSGATEWVHIEIMYSEDIE